MFPPRKTKLTLEDGVVSKEYILVSSDSRSNFSDVQKQRKAILGLMVSILCLLVLGSLGWFAFNILYTTQGEFY